MGVPAPRDVYRIATRLLAMALVVIGGAMVVRALFGGGGALAIGVVDGVLFIAAGAGRLWAARG